MKSFPKQIKLLLALFAVVVLIWADQALAQEILIRGTINATLALIDHVTYFIGFVAGLFVTIGGTLVNWTLSVNSTILTSPTVRTGWVVSRDLANLGFVLAIILIAFATILRIPAYQMQNTLLRLIAAALLVNFSLVLAGVFLDFAGILTNFFIEKAAGGTVGEGLANAFHVQKILQQTEDASVIQKLIQGLAEDPNKHYPFTASVLFVAIFTTIVAISLISLAAMLYIRYIWLTILLILAPLAWLMWIWPDLEHLWKKWWSLFMKWTMFGPAVTFFIYLALAVAKDADSGLLPPVGSGLDASLAITFKELGALLARMISVLGILYGGLYTANAMGIAGAGVGFSVAKGVKNMMVGGAVVGGGITGGLLGTGAGALYRGTIGGGKTFTEDLRRMTAAASGSKIPFVAQAMQAGNRYLEAGAKETMEALEKEADGMSAEGRAATLNAPTLNAGKKAAVINSIAKNNELGKVEDLIKNGKLSRDRFNSFVKSSLDRGGEGAKILLSKNPYLAALKVDRSQYANDEEYKKAQQKEIAGVALKPEAIEFMDIERLRENPALLAKFKVSHLTKLAERAPTDQNLFLDVLKDIIDKMSKEAETIKGIAEDQRTDEHKETLTNLNKLTAIAGTVVRTPILGGTENNKRVALAEKIGATQPSTQSQEKPKLFDQFGNPIK